MVSCRQLPEATGAGKAAADVATRVAARAVVERPLRGKATAEAVAAEQRDLRPRRTLIAAQLGGSSAAAVEGAAEAAELRRGEKRRCPAAATDLRSVEVGE